MSWWTRKTIAEMASCSRNAGGRSRGKRKAACQPRQSSTYACHTSAKGWRSAAYANVAADSRLVPNARAQRRASRQFADQRNVARAGGVEVPRQRAVSGEVLPAIAGADIPRADSAKAIILLRVRRGERQPERPLLRPQDSAPAVHRRFRAVVRSRAAEVRSEERIRAQAFIAVECNLDQDGIAPGIGDDAQPKREPCMFVDDLDGGNPRARRRDTVGTEALDLDPEPLPVGHDESEITDLRDVRTGVIDLVQNAVASGKPQTRGSQCATHHVLGTAGPRRGHTRMAKCVHVVESKSVENANNAPGRSTAVAIRLRGSCRSPRAQISAGTPISTGWPRPFRSAPTPRGAWVSEMDRRTSTVGSPRQARAACARRTKDRSSVIRPFKLLGQSGGAGWSPHRLFHVGRDRREWWSMAAMESYERPKLE